MSFDELLKEVGFPLKRISIRFSGFSKSLDKDDLYQQALLCLWDKYKKQELNDKTKSFIVQGCVMDIRNYIRKQSNTVDKNTTNTTSLALDSDQEEMLNVSDNNQSAKELKFKILLEDIKSLLDKQEKTVFLQQLQGRSLREIGLNLGVSHVMVLKIKKRIQSKCQTLRKEFYEF